jgi:hypothetical protein
LDEPQRVSMLSSYRDALKSYADAHGCVYVDPNPGIEEALRFEYPRKYLVDHIHPNAD